MIKHIGFIMDGNRRFSVKNDLNTKSGYSLGMKQFLQFVKYQVKYNIFETTYYALSTENLKNRNKDELKLVYSLIEEFIDDNTIESFFMENKIKISIKGDLDDLKNLENNLIGSKRVTINLIKDKFNSWNDKIGENYKFKVNICLNYGGQREILHSFKKIYKQIELGEIKLSDVNEKTIKNNIYFNDSVAPEIIVRPGDAPRLSGFMLWDSCYSEIYLTKKLWPELKEEDFIKIMNFYNNQKRNFGK